MYLQTLKGYYKNLFSSPIKLLGVALVVIIALCFGFVMVISYSLVPDAVADMPIAVVNNDRGAGGTNYGDDVIDTLKDNDDANWQFIDGKELEEGIQNTEYMAAFEIPRDFSRKIENKQQADLIVYKNMRRNFIYAQLFKVIQTELKTMVSQSITEQYGEGAFEALEEVKDGMSEAADGSKEIEDGIGTVQGGANSLASGSSELSDGAEAVDEGAGDLQAGIDKLNKSVSNISANEISLSDEQKSAISSSAVKSTKTYADQLSIGIGEAVASSVQGGLLQAKESAASSAATSALNNSSAQALIEAAASSGGMTKEQAKAIIGGIASETASATLDSAAAGVSSNDITAAVSDSVSSTVSQIAGGVASNTADAVISQVNTKMSETISSMKSKLTSATGQLDAGAKSLKRGTSKVSDGAGRVSGGASRLANGVPELATGANTLTTALQDGEKKLKVNLTESSEYMGEYMADPLDTNDTVYGEAKNYGEGVLPLFLSLALWLGALIIYILLPSQPAGELQQRRFSNVFGTWTFMGTIGIVEAIAVSIGALIFGMSPFNTVVLFLFSIVASEAFMAVVNCFVQLMGLGGSAICVLLTIFQISACEGTFPAKIMPGFYDAIRPFLPMNYTIDGFREIFFGDSLANLGTDVLILLIFTAIFIVIDLLLIKVMTPRREYIAHELGK